MLGPCMCGDPYCPSCGPAQGNYKCPHCGTWSEDGECPDPDACDRAERSETEAYAKQQEEWEEMADAGWNEAKRQQEMRDPPADRIF